MIITCTGGRNFDDFYSVNTTLDILSPSFVYVGDCKTGADKLVLGWCMHTGTSFKKIEADWAKYDLAAGPIRNEAMCQEAAKAGCRLLIAFVGHKGTLSCMRAAKRSNMIVMEVKP